MISLALTHLLTREIHYTVPAMGLCVFHNKAFIGKEEVFQPLSWRPRNSLGRIKNEVADSTAYLPRMIFSFENHLAQLLV